MLDRAVPCCVSIPVRDPNLSAACFSLMKAAPLLVRLPLLVRVASSHIHLADMASHCPRVCPLRDGSPAVVRARLHGPRLLSHTSDNLSLNHLTTPINMSQSTLLALFSHSTPAALKPPGYPLLLPTLPLCPSPSRSFIPRVSANSSQDLGLWTIPTKQ